MVSYLYKSNIDTELHSNMIVLYFMQEMKLKFTPKWASVNNVYQNNPLNKKVEWNRGVPYRLHAVLMSVLM